METNVEPTLTVLRGAVAPPARGALDRDERLVKDGILRMGALVESQVRDAIRAVVERDASLAEHVIAEDARVNEMQREIADTVLMTIATQSPVARDLRFLIGLDHVAFELERIGDHASSIAKQVKFLADSVTTGAWDISVLADEPDRAKVIAFAPPLTELEATYLVPAGSSIRSVEEVDRKGMRIVS